MWRWLDPILNPLACLPNPPAVEGAADNADSVLRRLEALLRQQKQYALSGDRRSLLRGQGLDFADLREYVPGDDIRKMDWNVFARTLTPHVREYHEEKQLTLWLVVDLSPSMRFGKQKTKAELAIELAGLLGLMAQQGGHQLGAFIITGTENPVITPKVGHTHVQHIVQRLLDVSRQPMKRALSAQALQEACQQLTHVVQKHSTVMVLSDFLAVTDDWSLPLGHLARYNQLLHCLIYDPVEMNLPSGLGVMEFRDPETGELVQVDTNARQFHQAYQQQAKARLRQVEVLLGKTGRLALTSTEESPLDALLALLSAGKGVAA